MGRPHDEVTGQRVARGMRVLFVAAPLLGHVFPLVPLASALRAAGHEVLVATGGDALSVRDSGVEVADVAAGIGFGRIAAATALRHPLELRSQLTGGEDLRFPSRLFAAVNARMAGPLLAAARRWQPDLVVHEPFAVAGALAAAELSVPAVVHEVSLFDGAELAAAALARTPWPAADPVAVLRIAPPSLMATGDAWPPGPPGSPARRRVAAGQRPHRGLGALPRVLPTCAAVVHHGGAGTLFGALAAGIPQLVEPGAGDRPRHARLIARRGAGLAATDVTADLLTRLVTDPALATAAREVSAEVAAMPAPARLVARLETLVG